ncbi:Aminomethyltransferase (glycine cleavage system T protein) (EC 2.1.2.10) [uncultured Gammaproteobacteria bacterium]|jgi:aminomethyltransferase|uniref:Aminomethyltransferase n=3 Tax=sulfur-oxidizing symbionts TaxID=32036 RepID=A0A1H6KLG7_9GAMM|nr:MULTISPECIES: glycine cleavage system aminomethyltransferase GcvT [sulfur-oxidizing symbionts]CAC5868810.1 Aminomethyltransferase (glycine cleavage system T protein) (EC 2.1.2.10) [uncultured Gammaproteobacteria bacterium]CAB5505390.1 Aminomethyltransferase (glycine cleavage system T protein) (EC [Bathymodiolus thermophilus thioautotrophic gill symbiont]CAB5507618.1 Aminomethyltransferase (glycine cleavage system T protein) (EC [Bathymodiolus azoricus thioautotrophic gill symbiont]CAC9484055
MMKQTPLYQAHLDANGKMVDFGGWEMPLNYGSQLEEHNQVRHDVGMFDVSHMSVVDFKGAEAKQFLRVLIANDVDKLKTKGKALYSCMLNEAGGVIDDLIVYYQNDTDYRMVINAGTTEKDIAWINAQAQGFDVCVEPKFDLAMIAVQGPNAREKVYQAIPGTEEICGELKPFNAASLGGLFIARTGYTGEDGFEIMLPSSSAEFTWKMLLEAGVKPCGLGARDTLRLEAGMSLYGSEMNEAVSPLEAALTWTLDLSDKSRAFVGRDALEILQQKGTNKTIVGLVLEGKGVIRDHQKVMTNLGEGEVTSGSFSPTMGKAIALASVPKGSEGICEIEMRHKMVSAKIVKPPFVRNGKILV